MANSLAVWFSGDCGFTGSMGVSMAPALTAKWLYPRIVWGGLWGLLFVMPVLNSKAISKGAVMSIFPTLFQLLVVFPHMTNQGLFGLRLGELTPLVVAAANLIWGVVAALAIKLAK